MVYDPDKSFWTGIGLQQNNDDVPKVVVTDIKIPFWRTVVIMLKWMAASIPAAIVFYLILFMIGIVFGIMGAVSGTI